MTRQLLVHRGSCIGDAEKDIGTISKGYFASSSGEKVFAPQFYIAGEIISTHCNAEEVTVFSLVPGEAAEICANTKGSCWYQIGCEAKGSCLWGKRPLLPARRKLRREGQLYNKSQHKHGTLSVQLWLSKRAVMPCAAERGKLKGSGEGAVCRVFGLTQSKMKLKP